MAGRFCQECGAPNEAAATTCVRCGATLRAGIPSPSPPTYGPPMAYGQVPAYPPQYVPPPYAANWVEAERRKQADRTKTGVLLLAVGALLSWVPLVNAIGGILALVGAILVILGRKAFGRRHATFVLVSVAIFLMGIAVPVFFVVELALVIVQGSFNGDFRGVAPFLWPVLFGSVAATAVTSVAWVLFVHELSTKTGRIPLYTGLAASAIVGPLVLFFILATDVNAVGAATQTGGVTSSELQSWVSYFETQLDFASAPQYLLFGIAYFLVYQRLSRGEIPPPTPVPSIHAPYGVPPPGAPTGSAPPTTPPTPRGPGRS